LGSFFRLSLGGSPRDAKLLPERHIWGQVAACNRQEFGERVG
jgi:hypothetical protein